jgi:hypothetical protein
MDYPNRRRLKLFGHLSFTDAGGTRRPRRRLAVPGYRAKADRAAVLRLVGLRLELPAAHPAALHLDELGDALAPLRARDGGAGGGEPALKRRLGEV